MQKEIQLTDKTLLVVSVTKEASDLTLPKVGMADLYFRTDDKEYEDGYISVGIPQGDWQLLGIYPELTEEQSKSVVESYYGGTKFHNYIGDMMLDTAKESFQSLMEREKCYTVNPLKFDPTGITTGEWQEAQQRTFSKYAILIKSK